MHKQNHAIPILEYHDVTASPITHGPWTVSLNDFNDQMSYLNHNFQVIPLRTLLNIIRQGKPVPENTVAITFDDGYRSNYKLAFPTLQEYRMPATIFIVVKYTEAGKVGNSPALTWSNLKTMISSGLVDIESHTYNLHRLLPSGKEGKMEPAVIAHISTKKGIETQQQHDRRIATDLAKSRQILATRLGTKSDILCWPFGIYSHHEIAVAKKAGFIYMIGKVGYSNPQTNTDEIRRVVVPGGMPLKDFIELVHPRSLTYSQAILNELQRIKMHIFHLIH